jgi:hypothetical protein
MAYVEGMFLINHYDIEIGFLYTNEDVTLSEMAFDQIDLLFNLVLPNSIVSNKEEFEDLSTFQNNFFMVPDKINDQAIASQLFLKLISISGDNLSIEYITISSTLGKNIVFTIDLESPELEVLLPTKEKWWGNDAIEHAPWWLRNDSATYDMLTDTAELFTGPIEWKDVFKETLEEAEKKDGSKKRFHIIDGGKNVH